MTDQIPPDSRSNQTPESSPKWGPYTKLVVGLTIVALVGALLVRFRQIVGPLLLAFILAFLLHPLASRLNQAVKISWRTSVNLIYLILVIILGGFITAAGFAIIQQTESLVNFFQRFVNDLPSLVADLSTRIYTFGPFQLDFSEFDLTALANQLLDAVQPLLGQAGGLISRFATGAAAVFVWGTFVLLISYFLLSETGQFPEDLVHIEIPGYDMDARRLGRELTNIWNAFLRGQMVISLLVVLAYSILLTVLGVRFTLAIAIMAGLARFIPWVGPFITWSVTAIVAFFQVSNYYGLEPLSYTLLVVVACLVVDQIFDNLVVPRVLGQTLGVHPAGVLISAIIITSLIGIVGLVVAAPLLATLNLLGRYIFRKMFDLDPWPEPEKEPARFRIPWSRLVGRLRAWWASVRKPKPR